MARYGSFKYGAKKYGTDATITTIQWGFIVDWDNDGYQSGENEASGRLIDVQVSRGRDYYIEANGSGLERYQPGMLTAVFDNTDRRYDPYNTGSPLYPNVAPGKLVDVRVRSGSSSFRTIMRGKITDIQTYRSGSREVAAITVKDGLQFLSDQALTIGLRGAEVDTLILTHILGAAGWPDVAFQGWPTAGVSVAALIEQWAIQNKNALAAIHELLDVELGEFVHQRDGVGKFIPSSFTYDSTTTITEEECLRDITFPSPWEVVRNSIIIKVYPRRYVTVNAVVFELDSPAKVNIGETIQLLCEFTYQNRPTIGQFPTYTVAVNTAADGSGTNITSQCIIGTDSNPGYAAQVYVTNNSGSVGYVTQLKIEVVNVSYILNPVTVVAEDAASQVIYGKRTLVVDSPAMHDTAYAKLAAAWLLTNLKSPQPWPTIQIENRADLQFAPYLYVTRIRLQAPTKNIDAYYRIGKIEHRWLRENGQAVRTTFRLEPYFAPFVK